MREMVRITSELERLAIEEERLEGGEDNSDNEPPKFDKGVRVKITRKDAYYNRTGVIVSPHGRLFWNVRLDRMPGESRGPTIQKKETSMVIVL